MQREDGRDHGHENNALFLSLVGVFFLYFLLRLIFFAFKIPLYIPPDEVTHFAYCKIFSATWGFPVNSEKTYHLGNLIHIPWFYYYVMGKLLSLNVFPLTDLVYLRLFNILLTCCTVIFSFRWIRLLTENRITQLFFFILLTNIPMLSFLGAAVSYDNLVNLCAVLTLYYTHCFFVWRKPAYFFGAAIALLIGCLTKISFLPFVPIFLGILVVHEKDRLRYLPDCLGNALKSLSLSEKGLGVFCLILLALCCNLYGGNLLRYGKPVPAASQVMSEEQFMQHRISARDYVVSKYRTGEWSYEKAVAEAWNIAHPGDQRTALGLLKLQAANKNKELTLMSRLKYSFNWFNTILANLVGINAHRPMPKTANELAIYQFIFLFAFFAVARYWNRENPGFIINQSLVLIVCYSFYLMLFHNYGIYQWSLSPTLGIQGRYIFPVLVPLLGVLAYYLTNFFRKPVCYLVVVLVSGFFIWGDFPYFQAHADAAWYNVQENAVYRQQRGDAYRKIGKPHKAIAEYQEAVRLAPDNAWYHRFLGDLYFETGMHEKALAQYLTAVSLQPQTAGFYYLAGKTYLQLGNTEEAIEQYRKAVGMNPANVWYHRFLGDLYRNGNMTADAIEQYRQSLQIEPGNKYCIYQLAQMTERSEN